jgi:hypothetical protein
MATMFHQNTAASFSLSWHFSDDFLANFGPYLVDAPTFTIRSVHLREMGREDLEAETVNRGRKIQSLEKKVKALKRGLQKQRMISKNLGAGGQRSAWQISSAC